MGMSLTQLVDYFEDEYENNAPLSYMGHKQLSMTGIISLRSYYDSFDYYAERYGLDPMLSDYDIQPFDLSDLYLRQGNARSKLEDYQSDIDDLYTCDDDYKNYVSKLRAQEYRKKIINWW